MQIPAWLRPPTFPDRTKTRQAAMLWTLLLASLAVSVPILTVVRPGGPGFIGVTVCDAMFVVVLVLVRRGMIDVARMAVPTALLGLISYIVLASEDGVHDVAITAYPVAIAIAALLGGTRMLILFTLLAVSIFGVLSTAEIYGVLVNRASAATSAQDIVVFAGIISLFALLLRVTLHSLLDSLQIAESNERTLAERNAQIEASRAEVERLNAVLSQRVAARTADLQVATDINELLFRISRDMNSAQDHIELVDAIARNLDRPEYAVTLSLYDTQDSATAHTVSVVAQRPSGGLKAAAIADDDYSAESVRRWLRIDEVLVVPDTTAPPADMYPDMLNELKMRRAGSFMMAELRINARVLGYLMLGMPFAYPYSYSDIRVIRAAADLAAAAVERMRLYSEQVTVAERLRDADEVKSRFMANMSHELRTPLNAILNFTRFVASGMLGTINTEQLDALSKTLVSGRHLLSLINDVLDVTKIESQMLSLFVEADIDLLPEIDIAVASGEALIGDKPLVVRREIADDFPLITGDRRRLRQVLLNLISNACKFTDAGTVTVSARRAGEQAVIDVRDTGPGIPPEEHRTIFEPFRQSKRGLMAGGGTGLGLAIARRLVEAHHGTLTVDSAPGKGAVFTVTLPIDSTALRAQLATLEAQP